MPAADLAAQLPDIHTVRQRSQAMAALDAILCDEPDSRYFSYDAHWAPGEQVASMRNGSGDDYSITFTPAGVYLRGFDHESPVTPFALNPVQVFPGLLDPVPALLHAAAWEPAWQLGDVPTVTVSLWRLTGDTQWSHGTARPPEGEALPGWNASEDGSDWLFDELLGGVTAYQRYVHEYFEQSVDQALLEPVFAHQPLTPALTQRLNPERDWNSLCDDLAEIGYPISQ